MIITLTIVLQCTAMLEGFAVCSLVEPVPVMMSDHLTPSFTLISRLVLVISVGLSSPFVIVIRNQDMTTTQLNWLSSPRTNSDFIIKTENNLN